MRRKIKPSLLSGSMTVEASLLIPLLLGVMLFLITLSVFSYNRMAACALAGRGAVLAAGMEHASGSEIESKVAAFLEEEKEHFPGQTQIICSVKASLTRVRVTVAAEGSIVSPFLWTGRKKSTHKGICTITRLNPAEYVRGIKIVENASKERQKKNDTEGS